MVARKEFARAIKRAAFERSGGYCELCGSKLKGPPEYHHRLEAYLAGDEAATLENCVVADKHCHALVTKSRRPEIDKTRRLADKRMGIRKRKSSLSSDKYKRKLDGSTVLR